jgi:hypothetical protein
VYFVADQANPLRVRGYPAKAVAHMLDPQPKDTTPITVIGVHQFYEIIGA